MEDYGRKPAFASFLPGISGIRGIPIWCCYVNRGQCVAGFGVENKDHAIMEFYPAHQAYQNVKTTGFRTFLRKDGTVTEAFADENVPHSMRISMNGLTIEERNSLTGLTTRVSYFTLPGERLGALARRVTVTNAGAKTAEVELLDGMPSVIPYGVDMNSMKSMGQTSKAWMQVEDVDTRIPYYRVRVSMDDTAAVKKIEGGNFAAACLPDGELLPALVDPALVFAFDTSLRRAAGFEQEGLGGLLVKKQNTQNLLPCGFFGAGRRLGPGEGITVCELFGQVEGKELLRRFFAEPKDGGYFAAREEEAHRLTEELTEGMLTRTASPEFDAYCRQTYLDNVLRGGFPMQLGSNKIFYVYSRKHGDLERDYNYFSMLPEFYSQGNGNFRDVNQNRRCDVFFAPFVGRENIHMFYSLIQLDGYNPLSVDKLTYRLPGQEAGRVLEKLPEAEREALTAFVEKPFTPGALYRELERIPEKGREDLFFHILDAAEATVNGSFGEGYWSDHWTYNLDLIMDYLEVFPDREREMLYEEAYTTFLAQVKVNPRALRYEETDRGLRQYHALDVASRRDPSQGKLVLTDYGKGGILTMTLLEKLVLLCTVKFATLDPYGMGVEMEGGKPGWYDALNGMPGMFGSSMAETYELYRMLLYTIRALKEYPGRLGLIEELGRLLEEVSRINGEERGSLRGEGPALSFWNRVNDAKEAYREKTFDGISGKKTVYTSQRIAEILEGFAETVNHGIEKAGRIGAGLKEGGGRENGVCPTYFTYEVPEYEALQEGGIRPLGFQVRQVPLFLEGPVRYLKLPADKSKKQELYRNVKNSGLYDIPLSMYKVNAPLREASFELGRARAFTPGWLENESVWLHMEYKYLLELLRSGLYEEFFRDFRKACIPFLDPEVYGRSIYENSSFIASSSNPDESCRGRGFVARLSGSTVEFISMWKLLMFGPRPFTMKDGELLFYPRPALPAYLIPKDGVVEARLLGKVPVTYRFEGAGDYIPGSYRVRSMVFTMENGSEAATELPYASGRLAEAVRNGLVRAVSIEIGQSRTRLDKAHPGGDEI